MIAIMPNTISREILSVVRAMAYVVNRVKNNNEMSTENKGELYRADGRKSDRRVKRQLGEGGK